MIDSSYDEKSFLIAQSLKNRFLGTQINLVIAPTMNCNFRCPYCYESHRDITMSMDMQDGLVKFVNNIVIKNKI